MHRKFEEIIRDGEIKDKEDYYFLYEKGFFGNKALTWNSVEEIAKSKWDKLICIRGKRGIPRSKSRFNFTFEETINYLNELEREGIPREKMTFNQSMPDENLTIQGEVTREGKLVGRSADYIYLTYSTIKEPMNLALEKETLYMQGLNALFKIKGVMDAPSYDNLNELFELFPESVIEFSCYDIPVGNLKRNTIFWEVRNY